MTTVAPPQTHKPRLRFESRWIFAFSVFVASFLLFQIQPVAGKAILPWFGGSAAVWSTCLLFYQCLLSLGYLYAHLSTSRLRPRTQSIVHGVLIGASLLLLPIGFRPDGGSGNTYLRVLTLLGGAIGPSYFLLASTSPLIQAWFVSSGSLGTPYRLFALSNLASLLGLVAYPLLIEPHTPLTGQLYAWSWTYLVFAALCIGAAIIGGLGSVARKEGMQPGSNEYLVEGKDTSANILWFALPACASSLLLAITSQLTQNIAPVPLLWIAPLGLYLATFVLCFDRSGWYSVYWYRFLMAGALYLLAYSVLKQGYAVSQKTTIALHCGAFFVCCMFCHGELAKLKPPARSLTGYYLTMSFGGAFGGLFAGLGAPYIFRDNYELPVSLVACALLACAVLRREANPIWKFWVFLSIILSAMLTAGFWQLARTNRVTVRNFYGVLSVRDSGGSGPDRVRALLHGRVNHGEQFLSQDRRRRPLAYYAPGSGVELALRVAQRQPRRVGIVGLGAGTVAAYARQGDIFRFYEINPLVIDIARKEFSYLSDSKGTIEIVEGDGRLALEKERVGTFDMLVLDAFSGDSVPVHLLTLEAFTHYFRLLKPNGVLTIHVTNTYLDLAALVAQSMVENGKRHVMIQSAPDSTGHVFAADWILAAADDRFLGAPEIAQTGKPVVLREGLKPWTDDYSNLVKILR